MSPREPVAELLGRKVANVNHAVAVRKDGAPDLRKIGVSQVEAVERDWIQHRPDVYNPGAMQSLQLPQIEWLAESKRYRSGVRTGRWKKGNAVNLVKRMKEPRICGYHGVNMELSLPARSHVDQ